MIRLIPNPTFKARVRFTQPGADDALVEFEFRHKGPAALSDWWASAVDRPASESLAEVIIGWSGVHDELGNEVAFSSNALMVFIASHTPRGRELLATYLRELTESRQKN